jgi:hypothetical protein
VCAASRRSRARRAAPASRVRRGLLVAVGLVLVDLPLKFADVRQRLAAWLTARSEVTDRMLILGERHLRRVLGEYARHYNGHRPHRALQLQPPRSDRSVVDITHERIRRRPVLGGLITEYERAA